MSAYLKDVKEYSASFYVIKKGDVEIDFTDVAPKNKPVEKGQPINFKPMISNNGQIDAYLFVELEIEQDVMTYSINNSLCQLSSDATVYYYGVGKTLYSFSPTERCEVFDSITITANEGTSCDLTIKAYAIQTIGYEDSTPQTVWNVLKDAS